VVFVTSGPPGENPKVVQERLGHASITVPGTLVVDTAVSNASVDSSRRRDPWAAADERRRPCGATCIPAQPAAVPARRV